MQEIIKFKNVDFSYTENSNTLNDICLSINRGKIVAIMGGSGCGKTTLLKLISGQLKATNGAVNVLQNVP